MRLMLGTPGKPSLLVTVEDNFDPTHFEFTVINGAWDGVFINGHITVQHYNGSWSALDVTHILTEDQDRLRGDYETVFNNFDNPDYIGPVWKKVELPADWDDDIPF